MISPVGCRILLAALLIIASSENATGQTGRYKGRLVTDVLNELRERGLKIIYSTEIVQPQLRVLNEPVSSADRERLNEILLPHALTSIEGPDGAILIVRKAEQERETAGVPFEVAGIVRDSETGQPLDAAMVAIGGVRVETDASGRFRFRDLSRGVHEIKVGKSGYIVFNDKVIPAGGKPEELVVQLIPAPVALEDIIVTPSQFSMMESNPEQKQFLTKDEVDRIPHLSNDLFRAIGRLPGTASGDISARFNVRGGEEDDVLVLLDGVEIYEPFHLKDFQSIFSIVDSEAIGGVDFMAGGFPAQYGDRSSAVIDLTSSAATSPRRTQAGVSFVNSRLLSQGTFREGRGEWLLSARRGYLDIVLGLVQPDVQVDPSYWDMFGKLQSQLGERHVASINVLAAFDKFDFDDDDERANAEYGNQYVWLNVRSGWSPALFSQTVVSAGEAHRIRTGGFDDFRGFASVSDDRSFEIVGVGQDWSLSSTSHLLKAGWDFKSLDAHYDYASAVTFEDPFFRDITSHPERAVDVELDPSGNQTSMYVADRFRITNAFAVEVGGRWDRQSYIEGGDEQFSPRLNAAYTIGARTAIRGSWGHYYQSQGINEIDVTDGEDHFYRAEKSEQILLEVQHRLPNDLVVRFDAYHKKLSNLKPRYENLFDPLELFPEVTFDRVRIAPRSGQASGVELLVENKSSQRVQWWASYTRASVTDRIDGRDVPRAWDQPDAVSFSVNYRRNQLWNFNLAGVYHSGWPTTEVSGELLTAPDGTLSIRPILGRRNEQRLPVYHRLDIRASRQVDLKFGSLRFFLEIYNLLNRKNVCCVEGFTFFGDSDGSVRVERREDEVIGWIPSFGIAVEF